MRKLEPIKITYDKTLRDVLFFDFKSTGKEFPIKGGWGYSMEEAIIIDKNDPAAIDWQPFNGVAMEYIIAKQRIHEELIIFRSKGDKFTKLNIQLQVQRFMPMNDGKSYDFLAFDVSAFHDSDWEAIDKEILEKLETEENFDFIKFIESKSHLRYQYSPEFWFEISSFT